MSSLGAIFITEISSSENIYSRDRMLSYLEKALLISFFSFTIAVCVGKEFLQVIWKSDRFNYDDIVFAYYIFIYFFFTMLISMTENLYQRSNIARDNINRQYIGSLIILLLSSFIFVYIAEPLGFYAIILFGLLKGIPQLVYTIYINFFDSRQHFVIYDKVQIFKALLQSFAVIASIYLAFDLTGFKSDLSRPFLFGLMCIKALVATALFFFISKYLKIYNLRRVLSQ